MILLNHIRKFQQGGQLIKPKNISNQKWDEALNLYNSAKKAGDKFPELTLAQAILETGWFKSPAGKYNYFGQKATQNQKGSSKNTREVLNGNSVRMSQRFRDYDTLDEAMSDRQRLWGKKYNDKSTVEDALYSIWQYDPSKKQGKGYATDPKYDTKIKSILNTIGVAFNSKGREFESEQTQTPNQPQPTNPPQQPKNFDVATLSYAEIYEQFNSQPSVAAEMIALKRDYEDRLEGQAQQEQQQIQDYQKQQLLQAQQQKETLFSLLSAPSNQNEKYNNQILQESLSKSQPFRFSTNWFNPQQTS